MKRPIKIVGVFIASAFLFIVIALFLFRIFSPSYLIPYVIKKVEKETNGRYTLSVNSDSLQIRFISMTVRLGETEFKRNTSVNTYSNIKLLDQFDVGVRFESFNITALNVLRYVFSKKIVVDEINLINPVIDIRKNQSYNPALHREKDKEIKLDAYQASIADSALADTLAWAQFTETGGLILPHLVVKKFKIKDAHFSFYGGIASYPIHEVHGLTFDLTSFQLLRQQDFEIDDIFISIESVSSLISKNTARLTVNGIELHPSSFHVDSFYFKHITDKYKMNQLKGFRASWLDIGVKDISIEGLHPDKLINDSLIIVDKITIGQANLHLFKDKEEPKINSAYKPLPQEIIRNLPAGVKIDTIEIVNADLIIEMQAPKAKAPGDITLNQTRAITTNITNIPRFVEKDNIMEIQLSTKINNQVPVNMNYKFDLQSEEDAFWVTCKVEPFKASVLNRFLGSQFFLIIKTGHIDNMEFEFAGNNKANVGQMDFEYTKLKLQKLKGYDALIEGKPKTGFLSAVGNIIIPNNRSKNDKKYKPGAIYYEKEFNRPLIHGTIMSMLSGILSSMGITSRNIEKQQQKADALDDTAVQKSEETVIKQNEKLDKQKEDEKIKEAKKEEKQSKKEEKKEKKKKD